MQSKFRLYPALRVVLLPLLLCLTTAQASAFDTKRDNVQAFINTMVTNHQFDREQVTNILAQAESRESILKAMRRPAEKSKPWYEYRKIFLNEKRISGGVKFLTQHANEINAIETQTGVPAEIITAIIGVETNYGRLKGSYRVVDALSTLAFDYPPRSKFFTKELENFFLLAQEEDLDMNTAKGSYAGAMGAPQFIPSSYRIYSADGDNDGKRDLFDNWSDVFASVAQYFIGHGWKPGAPIVSTLNINPAIAERLALDKVLPVYRVGYLRELGIEFDDSADPDELSMVINLEGEKEIKTWLGYQNFYVITRYNRSKMYAMSVVQLAAEIRARIADEK